MQTRSTSSKDVAKLAGVSHATVSYVLNKRNDQSISETTRQKVLAAAAELKYRPNRLANGVIRGKSKLIGVIAEHLGSDFHGNMLNGICDELGEFGFHPFISRAVGEQAVEKQIGLMLEHRVEGLIWMAGCGPWMREFLVAEQIKCVIVDNREYGDIADCVVSDDILGGRLAVEHLMSLGHKRIAFCAPDWKVGTYCDRYEGYVAALNAAGIAHGPETCLRFPSDPGETAAEVRKLLAQPDPPTAFFCANDLYASFVRYAAEEMAYKVPTEIAVVGYSDQVYAYAHDLTTIAQHPNKMGRTAVRVLMHRIDHPEAELAIEKTPIDLVIRSSSANIPRTKWFG